MSLISRAALAGAFRTTVHPSVTQSMQQRPASSAPLFTNNPSAEEHAKKAWAELYAAKEALSRLPKAADTEVKQQAAARVERAQGELDALHKASLMPTDFTSLLNTPKKE